MIVALYKSNTRQYVIIDRSLKWKPDVIELNEK